MLGYHGQYLRVDLTQEKAEWVSLPAEVLRRFLGGVGLGTWLLHQESPSNVDALDAFAPLLFAFSPLVGTPLTTSAKFAVLAKSPLTHRINDALASSHFALAGKRTGADAIVLVGRCRRPSILLIHEGEIRVHPAEDLWGLPTDETTRILEARHGADRASAVIGPAGENRVRYATISMGTRHAGRGGLGAVMGSKLLKAVVVSGSRRTKLADPDGVARLARDLSKRSFGPATAKYRELGTVSNLLAFNRLQALPTRNFQQGSFEGAENISGEALNAAHRIARASCAACTIGCEHIYRAGDGQEVRLEYESLFALGPLCGIDDREMVLQAARRCDVLGLDTISTGATLAFAMECGQRGLLDVGDLAFGKGPAVLAMLERIARRADPLGSLLAEGSRGVAEVLGGRAMEFAPHVKGLELPGYEPRTMQAMALGFAVGSRGADHNRSGAYEIDFSSQGNRLDGSPDVAPLAVETEDRAALIDSMILCKFLRGVFSDLFEESATLLRSVTGWDWTSTELRRVARRIVTARKLYNERAGWTPAEDTLPARFLSDPLHGESIGEVRLPRQRLQEMITAYYAARDWSKEGWVPARLRDELELHDLG
ncbi:MAG: aldehyde ferredoxin oxidoreductase family protein [Gemmataceae bacterium]